MGRVRMRASESKPFATTRLFRAGVKQGSFLMSGGWAQFLEKLSRPPNFSILTCKNQKILAFNKMIMSKGKEYLGVVEPSQPPWQIRRWSEVKSVSP
jgi:hypothetical protein